MISLNDPIGGETKLTFPVAQIARRDQAEAVLHLVALAINDKRKATADMDAELLVVKADYQPDMDTHQSVIDAGCEWLSDFAESHPEIFPKDRKSVTWAAGKFGYRTDTPSLALAKRSFGWAQILAVIAGKRLRKFIRTKMEVDKDAILARCGTLEKPTKFQQRTLPALGLKLVQDEKFFVEPDLTKTEVRA